MLDIQLTKVIIVIKLGFNQKKILNHANKLPNIALPYCILC